MQIKWSRCLYALLALGFAINVSAVVLNINEGDVGSLIVSTIMTVWLLIATGIVIATRRR